MILWVPRAGIEAARPGRRDLMTNIGKAVAEGLRSLSPRCLPQPPGWRGRPRRWRRREQLGILQKLHSGTERDDDQVIYRYGIEAKDTRSDDARAHQFILQFGDLNPRSSLQPPYLADFVDVESILERRNRVSFREIGCRRQFSQPFPVT